MQPGWHDDRFDDGWPLSGPHELDETAVDRGRHIGARSHTALGRPVGSLGGREDLMSQAIDGQTSRLERGADRGDSGGRA